MSSDQEKKFQAALQWYHYKVNYYSGVGGWRAQADIDLAYGKLIEIAKNDPQLKDQIPIKAIAKSDGMGGLFGALGVLSKSRFHSL